MHRCAFDRLDLVIRSRLLQSRMETKLYRQLLTGGKDCVQGGALKPKGVRRRGPIDVLRGPATACDQVSGTALAVARDERAVASLDREQLTVPIPCLQQMPGYKFLEHDVVQRLQAVGRYEARRKGSPNDAPFRRLNSLNQDIRIGLGRVCVGTRRTHAMACAKCRESSLIDACIAILLGRTPPTREEGVPR